MKVINKVLSRSERCQSVPPWKTQCNIQSFLNKQPMIGRQLCNIFVCIESECFHTKLCYLVLTGKMEFHFPNIMLEMYGWVFYAQLSN